MAEFGIPSDSAGRKKTPIASGVLDYFPDALAEVAKASHAGNEKHNPGQPLHWSKHISNDHADSVARHLVERGTVDPDDGLLHSAKLAWRALALLQIEIEEKRASVEKPVYAPKQPEKRSDPVGNFVTPGRVGEDFRQRRRLEPIDRSF